MQKFDWNKYVEETNEKFENSSPEEKRVMIAQDVIARINAKNLKANQGNIVRTSSIKFSNFGKSFKEVVNSDIICEVCVKGALLCAFVGRVNEFTVRQLQNDDEEPNDIDNNSHTKLKELFSEEQLDLIECAFERFSFLRIANNQEQEKAYDFYYKYEYNNDRLIAIMSNIISNKGTFIP